MSAFYDEATETATELIAEFGAPGLLLSTETSDQYQVMVVMLSPRQGSLNIAEHGNTPFEGKQALLSGASLYVPKVQDKLVQDDEHFLITTVQPIRPGNKTVAYRLTLES